MGKFPDKRRSGSLFFIVLLLAPVAPLLAAPSFSVPESPDAVVYAIPAALRAASPVDEAASPQQQLLNAKTSLQQFSATANPRWLGDAQRALAAIAESSRDSRFYLYRASVQQSLHQFAAAEADLQRALALQPDNRQGLLMRFNIALVQGQHESADQACQALHKLENDLYSASCQAHLAALKGDADAAYTRLKANLAEALLGADQQAQHWTVTTLADIAERAGDRPAAEQMWRLAMTLEADDLYSRTRLCELLLMQAGREAEVVALSREKTQVDELAVCLAIALQRSGQGHALVAGLSQRFAEARWRGESLHKRAQAQFYLFLQQDVERALKLAEANWQQQRELPDQRLLQAARRAWEAQQ